MLVNYLLSVTLIYKFFFSDEFSWSGLQEHVQDGAAACVQVLLSVSDWCIYPPVISKYMDNKHKLGTFNMNRFQLGKNLGLY